MRLGSKVTCRLATGFLLAIIMTTTTVPSAQAFPEIIVTVGDTVGSSGEQNSAITVYLDNVLDTVAAFELWLKISRPDMLEFQTELDTVVDTTYWECLEYAGPDCIDSISCDPDSQTCPIVHIDTLEVFTGNLDTVGTLISGWESVSTRSVSGTNLDIKITAIADRLSVPGTKPGIGPQGGGVLFRLLGDVAVVPDTLEDRVVEVFVQPFLDHFNISRPDGSSIGILTIEIPDTNCYRCNSWLPPDSVVCLDWEKIPGSECDSIYVEMDTIGVLDTSKIYLYPGSLRILTDSCDAMAACGDIYPLEEKDCSIDIGDLTYMINYLFMFYPPPDPLESGNVDCSTEPSSILDIGDLTKMIEYLFINYEPFCCAGEK